MNKNNPIAALEIQELIDKLTAQGFGDVIDCMLSNESTVYTKKGRLNKSSLCREMDWKGKQLEDALKKMREILTSEVIED